MAISLVKPFDPREQDVLTRRGEGDVDLSPPPTQDQLFRQDGITALVILVDRYGARTVHSWLRHIAASNGEAL